MREVPGQGGALTPSPTPTRTPTPAPTPTLSPNPKAKQVAPMVERKAGLEDDDGSDSEDEPQVGLSTPQHPPSLSAPTLSAHLVLRAHISQP